MYSRTMRSSMDPLSSKTDENYFKRIRALENLLRHIANKTNIQENLLKFSKKSKTLWYPSKDPLFSYCLPDSVIKSTPVRGETPLTPALCQNYLPGISISPSAPRCQC